MQWTDLETALTDYLQQEPPSSDFTTALTTIVGNAELRIYRDLDFLATRGTNASLSTASGTFQYDLGNLTGQEVGTYPVAYEYPVEIEGIAIEVSSSWVSMRPVSLDFLQRMWPATATTGVPAAGLAWFAMLDHRNAVIAPTPGAIYPMRVTGRWRPAPMSSGQASSYLGDVYPDLLFNAAMIEGLAWQRDFGAAAADPRIALSWEERYQAAKATAIMEEARKSGHGRRTQPRSMKQSAR